ncbi:cullin-1 isoform X1 [Jatropha curcas]|uniref:cullin-1 isoform X1 n=1 Tax=Jatropha curcas TaxID=180498 RepID=UPI0005FC004E|nr:cullin-1 isoform X1 [Jatropha curcas]
MMLLTQQPGPILDIPMTSEEGLKKIDDAMLRKKMIAEGRSVAPFTTAQNMEIYDCVYNLCTQKSKNYSEEIYEKYLNYLEEWIMDKVIPRLLGKHGAALLTEVTESWSEFKAFADSSYKFVEFLDRWYVPRREYTSLVDAPRRYFCILVCDRLYGQIQEAIMSLIIQERKGKDIDRNLLKTVFGFMGPEGKGATNYYEKFEQIMLAEAAAYYSELSMEWWFWRDSFTNYLQKVDWCLIQEGARAEVYPYKTTKEKLLNVIKYILLERNANRWAQNQKAQGVTADDKQLLSKYASLSLLDEGDLASMDMAPDQ